MTQPNHDVAVLIPALNEASVIGDVVDALKPEFPVVIVVDDGSEDDTASAARGAGALVLRHAVNLGQGAALATAIRAALHFPQVQWVATVDADGQHAEEDVAAMVSRARVGDVDVVLGTRFGSGSSIGATPGKRLLLRTAALYTRTMTKLPVTDAHNGLRVMSRSFAQGLQIRERGMAHASEIVEQVAHSGCRWVEFPVHIRYTDYSKAKGQPMINSVNILFDSLFR